MLKQVFKPKFNVKKDPKLNLLLYVNFTICGADYRSLHVAVSQKLVEKYYGFHWNKIEKHTELD